MTDFGYACTDHYPPLRSDPINLSVPDLKRAHAERHNLVWVLDRFGTVDDDRAQNDAARWLKDHLDCQQHIWEEGTQRRHGLDCPPKAATAEQS